MSSTLPYTYYSCPCTDINSTPFSHANASPQPRGSGNGAESNEPQPEESEDQPFNPYHPRANYALYPLENLLFCNECHEIRCPRCYYEEALYYFCPNCLFETSSGTVKSESNRCQRSCFQCPICIAPLTLLSFPNPTDPHDQNAQQKDEPRPRSDTLSAAHRDGPFILSCPYCTWSTLEIGIKFDKSTNIGAQLARIRNGGERIPEISSTTSGTSVRDRATSLSREFDPQSQADAAPPDARQNQQDQFASLADFYKTELQETANPGAGGGTSTPFGLGSSLGLESPGSLSRLLSMQGIAGLKKQRSKPMPMREASCEAEGLIPLDPTPNTDLEAIRQTARLGWNDVNTSAQQSQQALLHPLPDTHTPNPRDPATLRPIPTPLRTKRAKRCRTCRHNLIRPDDKRQSIRYKIRLVAVNHIPRLSLKPLVPSADLAAIPPSRPTHFVLTLRNPLYDPVRITLATPGTSPGPRPNKVTILCPQFEVGASTDVWDEALDSASASNPAAAGPAQDPRRAIAPAEAQAPEAGKIWARGRNWTAVVLEVVPAHPALPRAVLPAPLSSGRKDAGSDVVAAAAAAAAPGLKADAGSDEEDDEDADDGGVLEIPIFLRVEYETDDAQLAHGDVARRGGNGGRESREKERKMKRELAFWTVVGCGRVAS